MNQAIAVCCLIVSVGVILVCAITQPSLLSDSNAFLKDFVGKDLLGLLGVILAITLASAGNLHLAFNQLEERFRQKGGLSKARLGIKRASYALIWVFVAALGIVMIKPLLPKAEWISALVNGAAIWIVLLNILVLVSLMDGVFAIPAVTDDD